MSKTEREEELEERVDELEDTVQKMLPSRRDMLAGSAVAGAGLLGFGAGTASADGHNDGDTQWGADTNRDDYVVDHMDAISVSSDELLTTFYCSPRGSDGAAIQSALDAANNTSGLARVVVDPISSAPYVVNNAPLLVYDNTIVEIRENVKLGNAQDHNIFETAGGHGSTPTVRDNVHFIGQGGVLDGNSANNSATKSPAGFYHNCINLMATNASVTGVQMKNPVWHGVNIHGHSQDVTVSNCHLTGGQGGLQAHWHEADNTKWTDLRFVDNTVVDAATGSTNAILISGGSRARCSGNIIRNPGGRGINVYNGDAALGTDSVHVSENTITSSSASGIVVRTYSTSGTGVEDVTISENTIRSAGTSGVRIWPDATPITDVVISSNTIRSSTDRGIFVEDQQTGSGPGTNDITIAENLVAGTTNWSGVQIAYDSNTETAIIDNKVRNTGYNGLQISGSGGECSGNAIRGCARSGISVLNPNWELNNNRAKNNGQSTTNPGIVLQASDIVCNGNRCYDTQATKTQSYGIEISSGDYQIISDNNIRGNANAGVGGTAGANTVVTDNIT